MNIELNKPIWEDIEGYEGIYQVSTTGQIKSKSRFIALANGGSRFLPEKILRRKVNSDGYRFVTLTLKGKTKTHYIHRLVAQTFILNPENKREVNHKNGRKSDNKVENLEWVTHAENMSHAARNGLLSMVGGTHYLARPVINHETGSEYATIREAAEKEGYRYSKLRDMLSGFKTNTSSLKYKESGAAVS